MDELKRQFIQKKKDNDFVTWNLRSFFFCDISKTLIETLNKIQNKFRSMTNMAITNKFL